MLPELDEKSRDIAFAQGLLQEWAKTQPSQISEYLNTLVTAVDHYRSKWVDSYTDYAELNGRYTVLTAQQAELMQQMQIMRDQETERLREEQKVFWTNHENNLERREIVVPSRTNAG